MGLPLRVRYVVPLVVGLLVVLAGVGLATAFRDRDTPPKGPRFVRPAEYTPRRAAVTLPTPATPNALVEAVTKRYGGRAVESAVLVHATENVVPDSPFSPAKGRAGFALNFRVRAPDAAEGGVRPVWEAHLVAGAVREMLHVQGERLIDVNVVARLPGGSTTDFPTALGNVAFGQAFVDDDPAALRAELERAADRLGLTVDSIEILRPLQPAPAITVTTSDPARYVAHHGEMHAQLFGGRARFEGQFLRVNDESGRPVLISGASFRTGTGSLWIRADLNPRRSAGWEAGAAAKPEDQRTPPRPLDVSGP